jgi:hypothetical protein
MAFLNWRCQAKPRFHDPGRSKPASSIWRHSRVLPDLAAFIVTYLHSSRKPDPLDAL